MPDAHAVPRIALRTRTGAPVIGKRGTALAKILRLIADAPRRAGENHDERAFVHAVNVDDVIVAIRAQLRDGRRDRLEVGPPARFLETPQRREQYTVDALAPLRRFGECFVCGPIHLNARKCAFDIRYDGQRLHDIAEGGDLDDKDSLH